MQRRFNARVAGASSPPLLVFVGLVALIAVGAGIAWFVLHGSSTGIETAVAPKDGANEGEGPTATVPEVAPESATPTVSDEEFHAKIENLKGTPLKTIGKDGKVGTMTTYPLSGRVIDDRGEEPVYYFWIYLIPTDRGDVLTAKNSWAPNHFRNGEFHLDRQPAGEYNLLVESREHEPVTRTIAVPYEGDLTVRLHHGSCIRGVVRDSMQTPLKDIEVHLGVDLAKLDAGASPPMQRIVKTDDMGRYSFWKVPGGSYSLQVALFGDELATEGEFRLDPGGEFLRDFTLERLGTLKLMVSNVANQPVAKARVLLVQERDGRDRPVRSTYSDLKGVAHLDFLRQGSYKLRVQLQGFETFEQQIAVAENDRSREVPVRLEVAAKPGR